MKKNVKTDYVISKVHQTPLTNQIWSGVGQGNEEDGPTWLAIEIIMLDSMENIFPTSPITDPINRTKFTVP